MTQNNNGNQKQLRTLSMGAGVQTTALLLMSPESYDYCIFADTGDEEQETYYYIEKYLKPFCEKHNVKWITVKHKKGFSLMEFCMIRKIIPIKSRRWCTQDFKVRPINRELKKLGATRKNPAVQSIGISIDEAHRANFSKHDVLYVTKKYPLIEQKLSRNDCIRIIQEKGFPIPPKSGCDFCMFKNRKQMMQLKAKSPERFHKIVLMEKNDRYYPRKPLIGNFTLESLEMNQSIDTFVEEEQIDSCESGYCFV